MKKPAGISLETLNDALNEFGNIVGSEWVFSKDEDVMLYRDPYSPLFGESKELLPYAAVAPDSVEQVQAIVRVANKYSIPLYPISTGKNLGYGGPAPVYPGSIVLDLKRMNRVIEVNERNASVLVEPGVSYFDLYRYIQDNGYKVWVDVPDPGWGGPVGNSLDRGYGYTAYPYRDHWEAHCGMEVVLANGELVRTGMGAMPGAETWQQLRNAPGPAIDGMFSQSNFGVVTKMGFWLLPQPEAFLGTMVSIPHYEDLHPFIDILTRLMYSRLVDCTVRIRSELIEAIPLDPSIAAVTNKRGGSPAAAWDALAASKGLHIWGAKLNFLGPRKVIAAQWEHVKDAFSGIPGVRFTELAEYDLPLTPAEKDNADNLVDMGIPNLSIFAWGARSKTTPTPNDGHLWFSPVIPMNADAILKARQVFIDDFSTWKTRPPIGRGLPTAFTPRTFMFFYGFPITHNVADNIQIRDNYRRLVEISAKHGWGEYRTHPAMMESVTDAYSFNNHALRHLQETLKDAVDPNGILSAGRYGIWPKHLREARK